MEGMEAEQLAASFTDMLEEAAEEIPCAMVCFNESASGLPESCQPLIAGRQQGVSLQDLDQHPSTMKTSMEKTRDKRAGELKRIADEEFSTCNLCRLIMYWILVELPFYVEILCFMMVAYYMDVYLDLKSIIIFIRNEDFKYAVVNLSAMIMSNMYAFMDMLRQVQDFDNGKHLLILGFMTPFYGHMAVLAIISLRVGKKHRMLSAGKLAEAALEAFVSSLIQTYALIYSEDEHSGADQNVMTLSVCSSFFCVGYSLMGFDARDVGLDGCPGKVSKHISMVKLLVLLIRVSEVTSRITSLALFSVATRHAIDTSFAEDFPWPFDEIIQNSLVTLGPLLILLDLLVMITITYCCNRSVLHAVPSVLCFTNPLLEKGNPITMHAGVYYSWRLMELGGMVGLTYWIWREGIAHAHLVIHMAAASGNMFMAFAVSTAIWMSLLPIVRCCMAKHGPLIWYDPATFGEKPFVPGQKAMLNDLLKHRNGRMRLQMMQRLDYILKQGIKALADSVEQGNSDDQELTVIIEDCKNLGLEADMKKTRLHELKVKKVKPDGDLHKWNEKNPESQVGPGDCIIMVNREEGTSKELLHMTETPPVLLNQKNTMELKVRRAPKEDNTMLREVTEGQVQGVGLQANLYNWAKKYVREHKKAKEESAADIFKRSVNMGANLIPAGKFFLGKETRRDFLEHVEKAMKNSSVEDVAYKQMNLILIILELDNGDGDIENSSKEKSYSWTKVDLEIQEHKMAIVEALGVRGWESDGFEFFEGGLGSLLRALDTCPTKPSTMTEETWKALAPRQLTTLVELWRNMPPMNHEEREQYSETLKGHFRPDVEWLAMTEGAKILLQENGEDLWKHKDLLHFCNAGFQATGDELKLLDDDSKIAEQVKQVQEEVNKILFQKIADQEAKFQEALTSSGTFSVALSFREMEEALDHMVEHEHLYDWCAGLKEKAEQVVERCNGMLKDNQHSEHQDAIEIQGLRAEMARLIEENEKLKGGRKKKLKMTRTTTAALGTPRS